MSLHPLDLAQITAIRETVMTIDPDDDDLLLGMIEGETEAGELLDDLLEMEAAAKAHVTANTERIGQLQERNARLSQRAAAMRAGMLKLLNAAGLRKMVRAAATVGIRAVPPKVLGDDITDLDPGLIKTTYAPDRATIKDALIRGEIIEGWSMSNGGETISVRRS